MLNYKIRNILENTIYGNWVDSWQDKYYYLSFIDNKIEVIEHGDVLKRLYYYTSSDIIRDTSLILDKYGNIHIVFVESDVDTKGKINYIFYNKSTDTWESPIVLENDGYSENINYSDVYLAVDTANTIHLVFSKIDIITYTSTINYKNKTTTWQTSIELSTEVGYNLGVNIYITPDDIIHTTWYKFADDYSGSVIYYKKYTTTWQAAEVITPTIDANQLPKIVADSQNIYITYEKINPDTWEITSLGLLIKENNIWSEEEIIDASSYSGSAQLYIDENILTIIYTESDGIIDQPTINLSAKKIQRLNGVWTFIETLFSITVDNLPYPNNACMSIVGVNPNSSAFYLAYGNYDSPAFSALQCRVYYEPLKNTCTLCTLLEQPQDLDDIGDIIASVTTTTDKKIHVLYSNRIWVYHKYTNTVTGNWSIPVHVCDNLFSDIKGGFISDSNNLFAIITSGGSPNDGDSFPYLYMYDGVWQKILPTFDIAGKTNSSSMTVKDGVIHIVWESSENEGAYSCLKYITYVIAANTWGTEVTISTPFPAHNSRLNCQRVFVDTNNTVHIIWHETSGQIKHKIFNGSWQPETLLYLNSGGFYYVDSVLDSNDNIHVAWLESFRESSWTTIPRYMKYNNTTQAWQPIVNFNIETDQQYDISIVVDKNGGICIVWSGYDNDWNNIIVRKLVYNGTTWLPYTDIIDTNLVSDSCGLSFSLNSIPVRGFCTSWIDYSTGDVKFYAPTNFSLVNSMSISLLLQLAQVYNLSN